MNDIIPILTVTGSDSTSVSGVQADIKTISALGGVAVSAITSITVQNTLGIQEFFDVPPAVVSGQIEAVVNDVQPQVVKIGMIRSVEVLNVIIDMLVKYHPRHTIYVPIIYSTAGERLMSDDVVVQVRQRLIPLCTLVIDDRHAAHGESNAYASAVAVWLNQGSTVSEAQAKAEHYVRSLRPQSIWMQGRSGELYNEFLQAIDHYATTNSDVAFYANCLNVSPRYLAQVCRKMGKKSPKQIIDELLVARIADALLQTSKNVQELAYDFGFSSQAHFAKFFKKQKGQTPSEYRRKNTDK